MVAGAPLGLKNRWTLIALLPADTDMEDETDGRGQSLSGSWNHWISDASSNLPSGPTAHSEVNIVRGAMVMGCMSLNAALK
jgi:hypothetical protein